MKHVHDTWYLLADGTHADPNDVSADKDGVLRNKSSVPVALRANGLPHTVGHAAEVGGNAKAAADGRKAVAEAAKQSAVAEGNVPAAAPQLADDAAAQADAETSADDGATDADGKPVKGKGGRYKNREMKSA